MEPLSSLDLTELSTSTNTPWEEFVVNTFGSDYVCPAIDDVEVPDGFKSVDALSFVKKIGAEHNQSIMNCLSSTTESDIKNIYQVPFQDKNGRFDENKFKGYIELVNMISNIPDTYFDGCPKVEEICNKILFSYTQIFKD